MMSPVLPVRPAARAVSSLVQELTSGVMDRPRSSIFEQSENRLHAQKVLLVELLSG